MQALSAEQYISHFQYDCGIITESSGSSTSIDFDIHGIKKSVTSLAVVEPATGVPPKHRRFKRDKTAKIVFALSSRVFVPGVR